MTRRALFSRPTAFGPYIVIYLARLHALDGDPGAGALAAEGLREGRHVVLGGGVEGEVGQVVLAGHGRDVDDGASA